MSQFQSAMMILFLLENQAEKLFDKYAPRLPRKISRKIGVSFDIAIPGLPVPVVMENGRPARLEDESIHGPFTLLFKADCSGHLVPFGQTAGDWRKSVEGKYRGWAKICRDADMTNVTQQELASLSSLSDGIATTVDKPLQGLLRTLLSMLGRKLPNVSCAAQVTAVDFSVPPPFWKGLPDHPGFSPLGKGLGDVFVVSGVGRVFLHEEKTQHLEKEEKRLLRFLLLDQAWKKAVKCRKGQSVRALTTALWEHQRAMPDVLQRIPIATEQLRFNVFAQNTGELMHINAKVKDVLSDDFEANCGSFLKQYLCHAKYSTRLKCLVTKHLEQRDVASQGGLSGPGDAKGTEEVQIQSENDQLLAEAQKCIVPICNNSSGGSLDSSQVKSCAGKEMAKEAMPIEASPTSLIPDAPAVQEGGIQSKSNNSLGVLTSCREQAALLQDQARPLSVSGEQAPVGKKKFDFCWADEVETAIPLVESKDNATLKPKARHISPEKDPQSLPGPAMSYSKVAANSSIKDVKSASKNKPPWYGFTITPKKKRRVAALQKTQKAQD